MEVALSRPLFSPRQLDAFIAVADAGGFTQAAQRLHLSPSAVSNLVSELEAAVGFSVFDRTTRRVALSAAGREFLPSALSVQRQLRLASIAAQDVRDRSTGMVRVAAPLVVAAVLLPRAMAAYRVEHPRVVVRLVDTPVQWLADRVASGEADLAVGPDRAAPEEVRCEPLYPSPWVLWCAPGHPLAARPVLTWADLREVEICAAGHDHEESVAKMTRDLPPDQRITPSQIVDNISTALGLAAAEQAVTVSPAYVGALAEPLGLVMRRIVEPEVMRHMSLYSPVRRADSPAAARFGDFLRSWLPQVFGGATGMFQSR